MKKLYVPENLYTQVNRLCRHLLKQCTEQQGREGFAAYGPWDAVCVAYNHVSKDYNALAVYVEKGTHIRLGIHYASGYVLLLPPICMGTLPLSEERMSELVEKVIFNIFLGKRYLAGGLTGNFDMLSFLESLNQMDYVFCAHDLYRSRFSFECTPDNRWPVLLGIDGMKPVSEAVHRLMHHFMRHQSQLKLMELLNPNGRVVRTVLTTLPNGMTIGLRIRYDGADGGGFCPVCKASDGTYIQMDTTSWRYFAKKPFEACCNTLTDYFAYLLAITHGKVEGIWPLEAYEEAELVEGFMSKVEYV